MVLFDYHELLVRELNITQSLNIVYAKRSEKIMRGKRMEFYSSYKTWKDHMRVPIPGLNVQIELPSSPNTRRTQTHIRTSPQYVKL